MKFYKKQLKRVAATRKLIKAQRSTLRDLSMEGFTQVTFHTSTRSITLPFAADVTQEASTGYGMFLSERIKELKEEASEIREWWAKEKKKDAQTPEAAADDAANQGTAPGPDSIDN